MDQSSITPALIFAAAAAGDEVAVGLIGELIDSVAITITAVTTLVDPARVILGGSIGRALAPYLRRIETLVGQVTYCPPELSISSLGPNATVVGAIASALALHRDAHAPTLPDIRTDIRTEIRPDIRTDVRPDIGADVRTDNRTEIRTAVSSP